MKLKNLAIPALRCSAAAVFLALSGHAFASCSTEPYIGSICYTAANFCPANSYLPADGRELPINNYAALYSLLSNNFGTPTSTAKFRLPDLQARAVVGTSSTMPLGKTRGAEAVTLDATQVPLVTHTHTLGTETSPPITTTADAKLPFSLTVPAQNISVSGQLMIANDKASGQGTVTANAVLAKGGSQASIYANASDTKATTNLGPQQTFTGTTASQPVSGTAEGKATLSFRLPTSSTVGLASRAATAPVSLLNPQIGLTACIAVQGIYPERN